jgi:hypothetical protein
VETSEVLRNRVLLRLSKVTATSDSKWTTHSQSKPPSPTHSRTYKGKTKKVLNNRGDTRSDMVLYVLQTALYRKLQEIV